MAEQRQFDITIIGAGIAGSALAAALTGRGFSIALVESRPLAPPALPADCDLDSFDARVSALTPRSRRLLEQVDAWEAIAGYRICPYHHMTVWDADGTGAIEFDSSEVAAPALGYIAENRAVVSALLARVLESPDIHCLSPNRLRSCRRLASGHVEVELEAGDPLHTGVLVAADGAQSKVRELMEFSTREWDYGHHAIVATVETEYSHESTAWQRFLASGPLAFLPLPGKGGHHFASIVWSVKDALADDLMALDEDDFCTELGDAFEHRLGEVIGVSRRFAFPLRQRHAVDYVQPGVALVADAAHTIHPLAGQGINLGLQDVAVLAEEICSARERGAGPGRLDVLRRYQRRRKGDNLLMMAAMDGFKRLFEQEALPVRWLRNVGMRRVGQIAPLKQRLIRHAMGVG